MATIRKAFRMEVLALHMSLEKRSLPSPSVPKMCPSEKAGAYMAFTSVARGSYGAITLAKSDTKTMTARNIPVTATTGVKNVPALFFCFIKNPTLFKINSRIKNGIKYVDNKTHYKISLIKIKKKNLS